jgi:hypothetical protein
MAYASTYAVDEISNQFVKVRKDGTDKKVQFKEARRPRRFMRVPGLEVKTATGAISLKDGVVVLTGTAYDATLAAPGLDDDGKILTIVAGDAAAFTVTAAGGFNGGGTASDVATFAAAVGNKLTCVAWKGVWYVTSTTNVTLA